MNLSIVFGTIVQRYLGIELPYDNLSTVQKYISDRVAPDTMLPHRSVEQFAL
jgi:hypothetical protein